MPDDLASESRLRVVTFNVLDRSQANGPLREPVIRDGLTAVAPDVVALQEVTRSAVVDQARDWFGRHVEIVDHPGAGADGVGACLVSRHPVEERDVLDLPSTVESGLPWLGAVAIVVLAPAPIGPVLVVHHKPSWQLDAEHERERQAHAVASFIDEVVAGREDLPVVLLGDLDAGTDGASIQFLTGRRSLNGSSVRFEDAWEAAHPHDQGHTFTPVNPLVRAGQMPLERGRRIDHIMVRSGPHGPLLDVAACRLLFDAPVDGVWASDHFGVLADLVPPPHPPGEWASAWAS